MRKVVLLLAALLVFIPVAGADIVDEIRTLDGSGNNRSHPEWGKTNTQYLRLARPNYADGIAKPVSGPPSRYVSNRIFNDVHQNLFSENGVTQWGFVWGQFMDHTFGLRQEDGGENAPIAFNKTDPLESFTNTLGSIMFSRTPAAPGTGTGTTPRQQINTVSSYIDGFSVYGGTADRLEWLREGPVDGKLSNNGPKLLLQNGFLPRADIRGNAAAAPPMALMGQLEAPGAFVKAFVAGDKRANENIALSSTHTLFAREHNRIVSLLPSWVPDELKFQIARRVVGAEQQYVTYKEFLPALGVSLPAYQGYKENVNATLGNEFATVGYRAHSMIHGELEAPGEAADYTAAQLAAIEAKGVEVEVDGDEVEFVIPLNVAFRQPGPAQAGRNRRSAPRPRWRAGVQERRDDRQPAPQRALPDPRAGQRRLPGRPDAARVLQGRAGRRGARRGAWSGSWMPLYNDLRRTFGLAPKTSFTVDHRRVDGPLPDQRPEDHGQSNQRPEHPRLREALRRRREPDRVRYPGGRCRGSRRRSPHDARRAVEGDLRRPEQARLIRRNALRAARARVGVRRAAACDVEAAVPGAARR
jgi:hypothetical protein